ncbi:MAG TPA: antitoxin Xre/MbcA/ParS toxin-binding domain-containing protein [Rhizomicrobium sp.]
MAIADAEPEDREIGRTMQVLGGATAVGGPVRNRLDAHEIIKKGFKAGVLEHLRKQLIVLDASRDLEHALGISLRTCQRRKKAPNKRLSPEQSGRAWKFAEILGRATKLLGSQQEAEEWLERPAMALNQRRPIDLLSTPAGIESLEQHLGRLEYGVYT